jgi:Rrf2 family protein
LKDIAEREQISLPYLEQIIGPLVAARMVRSTRGARGGVWLAKSPGKIRLNEVIELLEGSIAPVDCLDDPKSCPRSEFCVTRDVWRELKEAMNGVLEATTLQDLVERQKEKGWDRGMVYQI